MNLEKMISLICEKGAEKVYKELIERDEDFKGFIEKNKGKTRDEMIKEYQLKSILG